MKKNLFMGFCLFIISLALFELTSFVGLFLLKKMNVLRYSPISTVSVPEKHGKSIRRLLKRDQSYVDYSKDLGWSIIPNGTRPGYQANSQGVRANFDYSSKPEVGRTRISTFGDSYTHGDGVNNDQTWQVAMEQSQDKLEVLNFGVPGYGLDQAYLRFKKDGLRLNANIVFIGFMSHDIFRGVTTYRPFCQPSTGLPMAKPRFIFQNDQFVLLENPMKTVSSYQEFLDNPEIVYPRLGEHDYFYHTKNRVGFFDFLSSVKLVKSNYYKLLQIWGERAILKKGIYNVDSEAYVIMIKTFDDFVKDVKKHNAIPIIVVFPFNNDISKFRNQKNKMYQPLLDYVQRQSYDYIDVMGAFEEFGSAEDVSSFFGRNGHYSEHGNRIVAKYLLKNLRKRNLL